MSELSQKTAHPVTAVPAVKSICSSQTLSSVPALVPPQGHMQAPLGNKHRSLSIVLEVETEAPDAKSEQAEVQERVRHGAITKTSRNCAMFL